MKQNEEKKIKGKKLIITLLELAIVVGCIFIIYILMIPKDRVKDSTYSYSKLEEVKEYEIQGEYITRIRPLTEYTTFKETTEYTLHENSDREILTDTLKVYTDSSKTQEVTEGYITSGMVLEWISNRDDETNKTTTYTICVIGDFTKDGDINITELTKIIKGVVGLKDWTFTEEEKLIADFNGDKEVNVVDIEECINYIVYGKLTIENGTKLKATDENGITWNYTYQDGEATDVYYESGVLTETVKIPDNLDGHPVVKLYNSEQYDNIFLKGDEARTFGRTSTGTSSLPIKNVIIPNTVTNIGSAAFRWCTTIKNIEIPNSVTSIEVSAFETCTSLTSVEMPDSVISIEGSAFESCTSLTSIEIPDSVTSIGSGTFAYCTSLSSIEIPDGVTSIGDWAFSSCTSLTSIEIPDSVTSIGKYAFNNTAWYNNQPDGLVYVGKVAYEYKGEMPENTTIELKEGTKGIAEGAFSNCTSLTSIEIPDSVTSIGRHAFENCTSLISIEIPDSVTSIEYAAFENCTSLTSIEIPNSVTSIGNWAFSCCTSLTSIEIPDSVTSIEEYAFDNTAWYNSQPDGVVYAGKVAYKYKGEMTENTTIELKEDTKVIANYAFGYCRSLTSIEIPNSVTNIGYRAFVSCEGLTNIEIPDSVIKIESDAFLECKNLTKVTMSKNVEYIGQGVFADCTNLKSIVIWKSVNELGYRTFDGWKDNQIINIEAKEIPDGWDNNWNYGCNAQVVYGYTE